MQNHFKKKFIQTIFIILVTTIFPITNVDAIKFDDIFQDLGNFCSDFPYNNKCKNYESFEKIYKTNKCVDCDLRKVNFSKITFKGIILERTDLEGAFLEKIRLLPKGEHVSGSNWKIYLSSLSRANLKNANLKKANLSGTILTYTNLENANLQDANLKSDTFNFIESSNSPNYIFTVEKYIVTNLEGANLKDANLEGANLKDANLKDANLEGAIMPDGSEF